MSRRKKFSHEQRLEAVKEVLENHMSYGQAAKSIGANESTVRRWVKRYKELGLKGLTMTSGTYSGEFKVSVVEYMHENHLSIEAVSAKFGVPGPPTVAKWERIYYEEGPSALFRENRGRKPGMSKKKPSKKKLDKQVEEDLIAEVQRLRMENDYLKKLQALVQERINQENGKKQK